MSWLAGYIEVFWDSSFTVSNVMEGMGALGGCAPGCAARSNPA